MTCIEKDKVVEATPGRVILFKPITTSRRKVTRKVIACTKEEMVMLTNINMADGAEVMFVKTVV